MSAPLADQTLTCEGSTYISVGMDGDDGPWTQTAECNGPKDCGWRVIMQEHDVLDGLWDVSVTSEEFFPLHEAHLAHSRAHR